MIDVIIVLAVLLIVGAAGFYVWKAKKSGQKCIGCPHAGTSQCSCGRK